MTTSSSIGYLSLVFAVSCFVPNVASAQWGNNAPRCPQGRCAPPRQSWGYHETKWSRWPGAVYPDMVRPGAGRPGGEIPPSQIDLPTPAEEAGVRPTMPTPARGLPPQPRAAEPRETESPIPNSPLQPGNENAPPNRLPGLAPLETLPGAEPPDSSGQWRHGRSLHATSDHRDLPAMRVVPGELANELSELSNSDGTREHLDTNLETNLEEGSASVILESSHPGNAAKHTEPPLLNPSMGSKPLDLPVIQPIPTTTSSSFRPDNPLRASSLRSASVKEDSSRSSVITSSLTESDPPSIGRANPLR